MMMRQQWIVMSIERYDKMNFVLVDCETKIPISVVVLMTLRKKQMLVVMM